MGQEETDENKRKAMDRLVKQQRRKRFADALKEHLEEVERKDRDQDK